MDTAAPSRLGNYVLLRWLGRGGMAEVFFAARTGAAGFQRPVVVKRMLDVHRTDPAFVRMFINEAKVAARLSHPNIVQIYELAEADGELFIAMEFIHGRNLGNVLQAQLAATGTPLPPDAVAWIAREVARGLHHAHRHRLADGTPTPIVHRDVSPHNIMIGYDGAVKVVDFGIAKPAPEVGDDTRTGELKGKVAYMSPEQIAGQRPGPAADQWALGVVMHELLTGKRLFKAATEWETAARVKAAEIVTPSASAPQLPAALDDLVMHALERDPHARFDDLATMHKAIDDWLGARFGTEEMSELMTRLFGSDERQPPDVTGLVQAATAAGVAHEPSASSNAMVRARPSALAVGVVLAVVAFALVVGVGLLLRRLRHHGPPTAPAATVAAHAVAPPPPPTAPATPVLTTPTTTQPASAVAPVPPHPHHGKHDAAPGRGTKKALPVFEDLHVHAVDEP